MAHPVVKLGFLWNSVMARKGFLEAVRGKKKNYISSFHATGVDLMHRRGGKGTLRAWE
jgi:hypothetical protein